MTTPLYFVDTPEQTSRWTVNDAGDIKVELRKTTLVSWNPYEEAVSAETITLNNKELAVHHPQFPLTLRTHMDWLRKTYGEEYEYMLLDEVLTDLRFLINGALRFDDEAGKCCMVMDIFRVEPDDDGRRVFISANEINLETIQVDGVDVTLVVHCAQQGMNVLYTEMDAKFPGWAERYRIGNELGLDNEAIIQHVFTHVSSAIAGMTSLTFD